MSTLHCSLFSLGCVFGFSPADQKTTLTGLRALKIAQRRLRPEVRSKLLSVSSARTDGSLVPQAWRFVFLDLATSGHSRVVTVAAKTSSEHPDTIESFSATKANEFGGDLPISQTKWIVDSDQLLESASGMAKLKGVLAAEYRLFQPRNSREPIWHLFFYGEGQKPIASFQAGAKSGAVERIGQSESEILCRT